MNIAQAPGDGIDRAMLKGSVFLTLGSFLLLGWSIQVLSSPGGFNPALLIGLFTYPALAAHFIGWVYLWSGAKASDRMQWIFLGSLLGFVLGFITLPWTAPRGMAPSESNPIAFLAASFRTPFFAYVPSVFAPVVVLHSLMFVLSARSLGRRPSFAGVLIGAGFLLALAATGLYLQLQSLFLGRAPDNWFLMLAGLTCIGYVIFALSWKLSTGDGSD